MRVSFLIIIVCLIGILPAYSTTIHVPAQFRFIQAGINAAIDGDTVLVAGGTYTGEGNVNLNYGGRAIVVISENGPESCIIDCENQVTTRGAYFQAGEDSNSVFSGFTITNGNYWSSGGIYCASSSPRIVDCHLAGNVATPD